jgi:hypothetical protein
MGSVIVVQKLRSISHLSSPRLPTSEGAGTGGLPKHHGATVQAGAAKKPLEASEVTRASFQNNALRETALSPAAYFKPAISDVVHFGCDAGCGNFLAIAIIPADAARASEGARFDKSAPDKPVDVKLQAVFKTCACA